MCLDTWQIVQFGFSTDVHEQIHGASLNTPTVAGTIAAPHRLTLPRHPIVELPQPFAGQARIEWLYNGAFVQLRLRAATMPQSEINTERPPTTDDSKRMSLLSSDSFWTGATAVLTALAAGAGMWALWLTNLSNDKKDAELAKMRLAIAAANTRAEDGRLLAAKAETAAAEARLALEKYRAFRKSSLRDGGIERLAEKLKPFAGLKFDAASTIGDAECDMLLTALLGAMQKAGMEHVAWQDKNPAALTWTSLSKGLPSVGSVSATNVIIELDGALHPELWPVVQGVASAFNSEGIETGAFAEVKTNAKNPDVVHLLIGRKL
jgi:hypothetical protein